MLKALRPGHRVIALRHVLAMQVPVLPERRLSDPRAGFVRSHLSTWSSSASPFPDEATVATYTEALSLWPAPHCALEYHRWLFRSRLRADGRAFGRLMSAPVGQPVCAIQGSDDPALPKTMATSSAAHVGGDYQHTTLAGAGHFPHEEQPEAFNDLALSWLSRVSHV